MDFVILKVNGQDVSSASHEDAVRAFQAAREPILVEVVRRAGAAQRGKPVTQWDNNDTSNITADEPAVMSNAEADMRDTNCNEDLHYKQDGEAVCVNTSTQTEEWKCLTSSSPPPPFHINGGEAHDDDGYHDARDGTHFHVEEVVLRRTLDSERLGLTMYYPDGDGAAEETDVLVQAVEEGGLAEADGRILPGDQIIQINGEEVFSKAQAERLLSGGADVTMLICRPVEEEDELYGLETVQEENVAAVLSIHDLRLNSRVSDDALIGENADHTSCDKRDTIRSETSTSSSALSGSSGSSSIVNRHQVDGEPNTEIEMTVVRNQMANIRRECESLAEKQQASRLCEVEEHIYETIPEVSESEESLYCHPYDPSADKSAPTAGLTKQQLDIAQWMKNPQPCQVRQMKNSPVETQGNSNSKSPSNPRDNPKHVSIKSGPEPGLVNEGRSWRPPISGSKPTTRECSLQTCLDWDINSPTACRHCYKCMRFLPAHNSSNEANNSTRNKNLKNKITSAKTSETNRNYVTFLSHGTLYTNAANLEETMQRQQQQLYQQLLRKGQHRLALSGQLPPSQHPAAFATTPPQQYHYVSSPSGSPRNQRLGCRTDRGAGEELQYQYKVKIRSDGSRYVARRPMRKQLLKERAARITEERTGVTTDDDAVSELKLGKYWSRDEKKRQLEHAREKKLRLQQKLGQKMTSLAEEGPAEEMGPKRNQVVSSSPVDAVLQKKTSTFAPRRRNPSGEMPRHTKPPKTSNVLLSVTTV